MAKCQAETLQASRASIPSHATHSFISVSIIACSIDAKGILKRTVRDKERCISVDLVFRGRIFLRHVPVYQAR